MQADAVAKQAGSEPRTTKLTCSQLPVTLSLQLTEVQQRATPEEKALWHNAGLYTPTGYMDVPTRPSLLT